MRVRVRCFAQVRERLGADAFDLDLPAGATLRMVVDMAALRTPAAAPLPDWLVDGHLRLARNLEYADPDVALEDGDEVALFPPTSGG